MKHTLICFFLFMFVIAQVNAQTKMKILKEQDTLFTGGLGCQQVVIKNKYGIDTLYADINEKVLVMFVFNRIFAEDSNLPVLLKDTIADLVNIMPIDFDIEYLDKDKTVTIFPPKYKKKYQKITSLIIENTFIKTKGEILYTNGAPYCINVVIGHIYFYVFPMQITQ